MTQKYEDGQANQAGCLHLLTNAVIVWNTVYMRELREGIATLTNAALVSFRQARLTSHFQSVTSNVKCVIKITNAL